MTLNCRPRTMPLTKSLTISRASFRSSLLISWYAASRVSKEESVDSMEFDVSKTEELLGAVVLMLLWDGTPKTSPFVLPPFGLPAFGVALALALADPLLLPTEALGMALAPWLAAAGPKASTLPPPARCAKAAAAAVMACAAAWAVW